MRDFFAPMYELLISFYGGDLGEHLYGMNLECTDYSSASLYGMIGLLLVVSSLACSFIFYYIINHPRFNRWYHWTIILLVNLGVNFFFGFYFPYLDFINENICLELIQHLSTYNCIGFGIVNAIWSIIWFSFFSMLIRWWSTNASTTPIPQ